MLLLLVCTLVCFTFDDALHLVQISNKRSGSESCNKAKQSQAVESRPEEEEEGVAVSDGAGKAGTLFSVRDLRIEIGMD